MLKKLIKIFTGVTMSSLGTAMVLNSNLGAFVTSAMNKGICNITGLSFWLVNILVELIMIGYATYKGEGLGWTAVINGTYGAVMIAVFHAILPHNTWLWLGAFIIPFAWSIMEKAGLGATGSNVLMIALMKTTGKSLTTVRLWEEGIQLLIALLWARQYVTWFTIAITFATPFIIKFIYKLTGHKPAVVEQQYINLKKYV